MGIAVPEGVPMASVPCTKTNSASPTSSTTCKSRPYNKSLDARSFYQMFLSILQEKFSWIISMIAKHSDSSCKSLSQVLFITQMNPIKKNLAQWNDKSKKRIGDNKVLWWVYQFHNFYLMPKFSWTLPENEREEIILSNQPALFRLQQESSNTQFQETIDFFYVSSIRFMAL